jgi:biotin carboxyl carrier protein
MTIMMRPSSGPTASTSIPPRGNPMGVLIELEVEARACNALSALKFAIVNSTRRLAPFDQAFLLERTDVTRNWRIERASSIATVDRHAAMPRAIENWINNPQLPLRKDIDAIRALDLSIGEQSIEHPDGEPSFPHALWLPLKTKAGVVAGLLMLRDKPWDGAYPTLLAPLADAYGHAWSALNPVKHNLTQRISNYLSSRYAKAAVAVAIVAAAFMPIPMTVLAPAEIVPSSPEIVSAPMDGVVHEILVPPGTRVEAGTPILRFTDTKVRNDVELAARAKSVAEAKYFRVLQSAVSTQKDMQDLGVAKAELAMAEADLGYARELLSRVEVRAAKSGIVVYSAKSDWLGKPVSIGERIIEIADPERTEIRIDVHVSDAIALERSARVSLFLDGDPLNAVEGIVERISYRPTLSSEHQLVFRTTAKFSDNTSRQIGLRGTARLSGETVSLGYYLFRRPIAFFRQKLGL